jgi:hypothetical protein
VAKAIFIQFLHIFFFSIFSQLCFFSQYILWCLKAWARHNTSPRWSSLSPLPVDWSPTRCSDFQRPRRIEGARLSDPDGFNIAHPLRLPSHDAQRTKAKRWFSFYRIPTASLLLCTPGLWCIAHINPVILPVSLTICAWQSRLNWIYALLISLTSAVVPRILNSQRPCKSAMIYVKSPMSYRRRLWRSKHPRKAATTRSFYRRTTC